MNNITLITNIIEKINNISNDQFKKNNLEYKEIIIEKKEFHENILDLKTYKEKMRKKASLEKGKPSNIGKKDYETNNEVVNILEDDIFMNDNDDSNEKKIDFDLLDREKKKELIMEYIQRRNIIFDNLNDINKIDQLLDSNDINLKKNINISKMYQHITKIKFIKKLENGSHIITLEEAKPKKTKNLFLK